MSAEHPAALTRRGLGDASLALRIVARVLLGTCVFLAVSLAAAIAYEGFRRYGFGEGSRAYWLAWHRGDLYEGEPEQVGSFLYTPAFAQLIWPFAQLPWPVFAALWASLVGAVFVWLLWPLPWRWRVVALLLVAPEVVDGNVWALFALVLVVGFRYPGTWAFPLLTKVTAGVGLVWFAVRQEWRHLAIALGTTGAVVAVSVSAGPGLWHDWLVFAIHGGGRGGSYATTGRILPPLVRIPLALALTVIGARKGKRAWLVCATLLAAPVFGTYNFAVLAALPRLRQGAARAGGSTSGSRKT